ncbi:MAG: hypothetical protein L0Y75_04625 [Acidobacteria bacterium]|nr:hypothetical protein [Acidobacteriota bacterium]
MIVLDEQLCREPLRMALGQWYKGKIRYVTEMRPSSVIKDDAVPELLLGVKQPTFVTINYKDFWRKIAAHRGYCVICIDLPNERWAEVSPVLKSLLHSSDFRTKNARMGKVISWRDGATKRYEI